MNRIPNPDLYKRMAVPFESQDVAQAAVRAFLEDVAAAREKHRIAEVAMIAGSYAGKELVAMTQTLGDQGRSMNLARALLRQTLLSWAEIHEEAAAEIRKMAEEPPPESE